MAAILVAEGAQEVPVGRPVLVLVDDVAAVPAFAGYAAAAAAASSGAAKPAAAAAAAKPAAATPAAPAAAAPAAAAAPRAAAPAAVGGRVAASPLARRLAKEAGVALPQVGGEGRCRGGGGWAAGWAC